MLTAGFNLFLPALLLSIFMSFCFSSIPAQLFLMFMYTNMNNVLGRIQEFVGGGSEKYPPKAARPRGPGSRGTLLNLVQLRGDFKHFEG